ncbi:MAG: aminoglycoside phosphotransferase family protein [Arenicellales bacterium]|nr:aminoglycoside phosphotransferase family protein [Arenicellales bacterium]
MAVDIQKISSDLIQSGLLAGEGTKVTALTGGVSSDIYLIEEGDQKLVVKQALDTLKVKDLWQVDITRNLAEQKFIRHVSGFLPQNMPRLLYCDEEQNYFVMEYLEGYRDWKSYLLSGETNSELARTAGFIIGVIHQHTWGDQQIADSFNNMDSFYALRIEPYLLTTASRHPELGARICTEAERLKQTRLCLVHGDYSPKNIMINQGNMVVLDCEVACYGDPAFDLAFLFNHFLLKALFHGNNHKPFVSLLAEAWQSYRSCFDEFDHSIERRVARLLLMLMLARMDGKSPVEYIVDEDRKRIVRGFVYELLPREIFSLGEICSRWEKHLVAGE